MYKILVHTCFYKQDNSYSKKFSNMITFIGHINNTVIKLLIYFNSHMHIVKQSHFMYSYRAVVHTNIKITHKILSIIISIINHIHLQNFKIFTEIIRINKYMYYTDISCLGGVFVKNLVSRLVIFANTPPKHYISV
jgi:hypothetical protein